MINTRGAAKDTTANLDWLDKEESVTSIVSGTQDGVVQFIFDPAKQPKEGIPDGVFFDLAESPF